MKIKTTLFAGLAGLILPALLARAESAGTPGKTAATPSAAAVKWHPGHYAIVQFGEIDERHLYQSFRGVQKTYSWRTLEPEKGRYDFSAIRTDLAFLTPHA